MARTPKISHPPVTVAEAPARGLFDRVAGVLAANDWAFSAQPEQGVFDLHARIQNASVRLFIDVFEAVDWQCVLVYSIFPVYMPEQRRHEALEAINGVNYRLRYGNLEMDLSDGEVRVRTVVEDSEALKEAMIERAIYANLAIGNDHFAALMAVAFGADPVHPVLEQLGKDAPATRQ